MNNNRIILIALTVVFVLFSAMNFLEIYLFDYEQMYDDSYHVDLLNSKYLLLRDHGLFNFFAIHSGHYPQLVYFTSAIFLWIFGSSTVNVVMSQSIYWFILIFLMYFLCREVFNEMTGFLSALLILSLPVMNIYSATFHLDIPQTAMTALSAYLLIKTDLFKDRKYTILFFIASALGMMTKIQFAFCFGGFFFYYLWVFISGQESNMKTKISGFAYILIAGLLIPVAFYITQAVISKTVVETLDYMVLIKPNIRPMMEGWSFRAKVVSSILAGLAPLAIFLIFILRRKNISPEIKNIVTGIFILTVIMQPSYGVNMKFVIEQGFDARRGGGKHTGCKSISIHFQKRGGGNHARPLCPGTSLP